MRNVLPGDIPSEGRYDFTLKRIGDTKDGHQAMICVIDNGPLRGKRVSSKVDSNVVPVRFSGQLKVYRTVKVGKMWYAEKSAPKNSQPSRITIRYEICDILDPEYQASEIETIIKRR